MLHRVFVAWDCRKIQVTELFDEKLHFSGSGVYCYETVKAAMENSVYSFFLSVL